MEIFNHITEVKNKIIDWSISFVLNIFSLCVLKF